MFVHGYFENALIIRVSNIIMVMAAARVHEKNKIVSNAIKFRKLCINRS